ncbi:MAG TPA: FMN-binding negative transcriptional regulator [Streptosporangiaceae bacterium]|nr:FMN-binding negative transcriptional regulator [Streptosporangiaceae bacterium]
MLVQPWDAAIDDDEWRAWLADGRDFGQLVVNDLTGRWPVAVPAHFVFDGGQEVILHLARTNPVWPALDRAGHALLSVVDDYAFVPATWRAADDIPREHGVPTSYYAAVQLAGPVTVVDDPHQKAEFLRSQLAHFQPAGDHGLVQVGEPPYGRMLSAIRGLRLHVEQVTAKFKYDDHKPVALREHVAEMLAERGEGRDAQARTQQLRRLAGHSGT